MTFVRFNVSLVFTVDNVREIRNSRFVNRFFTFLKISNEDRPSTVTISFVKLPERIVCIRFDQTTKFLLITRRQIVYFSDFPKTFSIRICVMVVTHVSSDYDC